MDHVNTEPAGSVGAIRAPSREWPTLNRPRLPQDILYMIACLIPPHDQRSLLLSCWDCHDAVGRLLYRSGKVHIGQSKWSFDVASTRRGLQYLQGLIRSMRPHPGLPARCNAGYLVTFTYSATSFEGQVRSSHLLAEVLCGAVRLRHLYIFTTTRGVQVVLNALRRAEVINAPVSSFTERKSNRKILPCLESIRTDTMVLLEAFMRFRRIHTAVLLQSESANNMAKLCRSLPPWRPADLRRLAMCYLSDVKFERLLSGLFGAFPCLDHLQLRTTIDEGHRLIETAVSLLDLGEASHLRVFAVNHGTKTGRIIQPFEEMQERLQQMQSVGLRMLILGHRMWSREDGDGQWTLVDAIPFMEWPWLAFPDYGEWLTEWQRAML